MTRIRPDRVRVLALVVIIAILMVSIWLEKMLSAKTQSLPPFNPPGCILPCMLGITPGSTNFAQAKAIIAASIPDSVQMISESTLWFQNASSKIDVSFQKADPREGVYVNQISALTENNNGIASLGSMIAAGFVPIRVFRGSVAPPRTINLLIVFGSDQQIIAIVSAFDKVSPETPITILITIAKQPYLLGDIQMTSHFNDEIRWLGFTSVDAYWNVSAKQ